MSLHMARRRRAKEKPHPQQAKNLWPECIYGQATCKQTWFEAD